MKKPLSQEINISLLHFDLQNPRFMGTAKNDTEASQKLFEDGGAKDCYESFKTKGFLQMGESLLVIKDPDATESESFIVLEGNCRLAGAQEYNKYVTNDNKISSFSCLVFDSRDAAAPSIAQRHIAGNKKWPALQKKYYYAHPFLDQGKTIKEIADTNQVSESEVRNDIKGYLAIKAIVDGFNAKEAIADKKINLGEKYSNADFIGGRIFNALSDDLNLTFDGKTLKILSRGKPLADNEALMDQFNQVAHSVVSHIQNDSLNTRVFNKKKDWKRIKSAILPDIGEAIDAFENIQKSQPKEESPVAVSKFPVYKKKKGVSTGQHTMLEKTAVLPNGHHPHYPKAEQIIDELSNMPIEIYRYGSLYLFRQLVDISLHCYSEEAGKIPDPETGKAYVYVESSLESTAKGALNHLHGSKKINDKDLKAMGESIKAIVSGFNTIVHDGTNGLDFNAFYQCCFDLVPFIKLLLN